MTYTLRDENGLRVADPDNNYDYTSTDLLELLEELGFKNSRDMFLHHKLNKELCVLWSRHHLRISYKEQTTYLSLDDFKRTDQMVSVVLEAIRSIYRMSLPK